MGAAASETCWACGAGGLTPAALPATPPSLRCPVCGMVRAAETDAEAVRDLYDASYYEAYGGVDAGYESDPERRRYESRRRLALVHRFVRGGRLLEIGSAAGVFLDAAHRDGFTVLGIEPAEELARAAGERFGVEVRSGFVEDADLEPGSADVICAWHVLEHIPEPLGVLRALRAVLVPGGFLALEVPNAASAEAVRLGAAWPHWDPAHHVGHYTPTALRRLLERAGYTVVRADTLSGVAYYPPNEARRPRAVVDAAVLGLRLRAHPRRPHRDRHELLRMVARA
jgi:2-polyprenyl-3-methyl-5-hydroxy-6-metoxy-1,4-benzoquinol methylase